MVKPVREPIILLDGAMATELAARGFELVAPLFSARALLDAPELVAAIHADYLHAGAQVLTTNSFNLHADTLARAGIAEQQAALALRAVELLTQVRQRALIDERPLARFRIAGSIPPRPRSASPDAAPIAAAEYRSYADKLALAGVDLILLETFTSVTEAKRALAGLVDIDLPIWLSVVAGAPTGGSRPDGTRLLEGDPIAELAPLLEHIDALLINCTQLDAIPAALASLIATTEQHRTLPLGLCPHFGKRRHDGEWIDRIVESDAFAEQMQAWLHSDQPGRARICLAGACCGSKPADIAAMRKRLQPDATERERAWTRLAQLIP